MRKTKFKIEPLGCETFEGFTKMENGQKHYPVGAFCWIWEELEQSM